MPLYAISIKEPSELARFGFASGHHHKYAHTALTFVFCSVPLKVIAVMDA